MTRKDLIENFTQDKTLRDLLELYFDTHKIYDSKRVKIKLKQLNALSKHDNERTVIVTESLNKNWNGFYALNE